jgi:glycosyltransferase involved in cell wall biosynthesis
MHIAHCILTSRFAGSERYMVDLANAQCATNQVSVIIRARAAADRADAIAHRLDPRIALHVVNNYFPGWAARRALVRLQPDIVHAHLSGACKAAAKYRECPRVATLHIDYKAQQHAKLDGLIAIAPWQLAHIPEPLREHCQQINNWSSPRPPSENARVRLRQQLGVGENTVLIGSLSRLETSKGLDILLQAFAQLADCDVALVLVGQGSTMRALQAQAAQTPTKKVHFVGFSAAPQDWLAAMDVFVSASRSEPFGLVILEAMSAGLPIIASASAGAQHLAKHIGRALVPIADAAALTQALGAICKAIPARQHYDMSDFDATQSVAEIARFYRSFLGGK